MVTLSPSGYLEAQKFSSTLIPCHSDNYSNSLIYRLVCSSSLQQALPSLNGSLIISLPSSYFFKGTKLLSLTYEILHSLTRVPLPTPSPAHTPSLSTKCKRGICTVFLGSWPPQAYMTSSLSFLNLSCNNAHFVAQCLYT